MSNRLRHKSCVACVQMKRKCDRGLPRCQRCIKRGSECHYIGQDCNRQQRTIDNAMQPLVSGQEQFLGQASSNWQVEQYHAEPSPAVAPCWDGTPLQLTGNFNVAGLFDNNSFDFPGVQTSTQQILSNPDLGIAQANSDAGLLPRVNFMAKRLAMIPRAFAQHGHTIFIHRMQFQQNPSVALYDAMSACALYYMRGARNEALVFGNLELKCQQLISSINTNILFVAKTELLAALQALLLYQIIRFFDGDIRLRAHAEVDEPITTSWAAQLNNMICHEHQNLFFDPNSTEMSIVTTGSDSNWNSWLVNESIRRTVIATFMLNGVYNFLKLGYYVPTKMHQCFTAQAALWGAQSAHDWIRAQETTARLEIWVTRWDETIVNVKPADLEEFGVLVMMMLWGVEATQIWLGDSHAEYGFEDNLRK